MTVGFTGTRNGMTDKQKVAVRSLLGAFKGEFHHGDCLGADQQARAIAVEMGYATHAHPAHRSSWRAHSKNDVVYAPKPPLVRNRDIVNASEVLIATPRTSQEQLRSGTWATVRYARKTQRCIYRVDPDGTVHMEGA